MLRDAEDLTTKQAFMEACDDADKINPIITGNVLKVNKS